MITRKTKMTLIPSNGRRPEGGSLEENQRENELLHISPLGLAICLKKSKFRVNSWYHW